MSQCVRTFAAVMILTGLGAGCELSGKSRQQEADAQRLAAQQAARQRDEQQPRSNPNYKKVVWPHPTEDPMHAGRPIDE